MNYPLLAKILGMLLVGLGFSMLPPAAYSFFLDNRDEAEGFGKAILCCLGAGLLLYRVPAPNPHLSIRTSLTLVTLTWILFSFFGGLPFVFSGVLNFTDAFFETASGFTTTGASVFLDVECLGRGILLWRAEMQFLGGMGIIVLGLAILPLLGASGSGLYKAEVPGLNVDKLMPRMHGTAKILWVVYTGFVVAEILLLKIFGMGWFDSVCHAFAALSTGGFSNRNTSLVSYNAACQWILVAGMFVGGVNFSLHYRLFFHGDLRSYFRNPEFRFYVLLIGLASALVLFGLGEFSEAGVRAAVFQVVSILTTTGFVSDDYELWRPLGQFVLFALLFVGACEGSTAGALKAVRVMVMVKVAIAQVVQVVHPQAVLFVKAGESTVEETTIAGIMGFFVLYLLLFLASSLVLALLGHDLLTSLSASAACLGNVGPGFGEVGGMENYFGIHDAGKWVLSFDMLAGRLELLTMLALLYRGLWTGRR